MESNQLLNQMKDLNKNLKRIEKDLNRLTVMVASDLPVLIAIEQYKAGIITSEELEETYRKSLNLIDRHLVDIANVEDPLAFSDLNSDPTPKGKEEE